MSKLQIINSVIIVIGIVIYYFGFEPCINSYRLIDSFLSKASSIILLVCGTILFTTPPIKGFDTPINTIILCIVAFFLLCTGIILCFNTSPSTSVEQPTGTQLPIRSSKDIPKGIITIVFAIVFLIYVFTTSFLKT